VIYVNLKNGISKTYDSAAAEDLREFNELSFAEIRGVALGSNGVRVDLPNPRRFGAVSLEAELVVDGDSTPVAERVTAIADGIVLSITRYLSGRQHGRVRIDLDKRGRPRWRPRLTYR